MQAYVASLLAPILESDPWAREAYFRGGHTLAEGDVHRQPELADFLESLGREGPDLVYRGPVAEAVDRACREEGGHLRRADFEAYRTVRREPVEVRFRGHRIWTNPPPASGGLLVGFGLAALGADPDGPSDALRNALILGGMQAVRQGEELSADVAPARVREILGRDTVAQYLQEVRRRLDGRPSAPRGTTHLSVVDANGNAAALSASNGEGSGWSVPGAGFMLNNMLGEADLQPGGLGRWPTDTRLTSMMAPTLVEDPGASTLLALGSGGSNRIRSAIFQVLEGVVGSGLSLFEAVRRPRLHVEGTRLEIEGGFSAEAVAALAEVWKDHLIWPERNLFFGGVHAVQAGPGAGPAGFAGVGDPRRGGVAAVVEAG